VHLAIAKCAHGRERPAGGRESACAEDVIEGGWATRSPITWRWRADFFRIGSSHTHAPAVQVYSKAPEHRHGLWPRTLTTP